MVSGILGAAK
jgi:hypothetical protein